MFNIQSIFLNIFFVRRTFCPTNWLFLLQKRQSMASLRLQEEQSCIELVDVRYGHFCGYDNLTRSEMLPRSSFSRNFRDHSCNCHRWDFFIRRSFVISTVLRRSVATLLVFFFSGTRFRREEKSRARTLRSRKAEEQFRWHTYWLDLEYSTVKYIPCDGKKVWHKGRICLELLCITGYYK